jgi:hypothetical protein
MDNWPWTTIVHGQEIFFSIVHTISHIKWTISPKKNFKYQIMNIVHDTWTRNFNFFTRNNQVKLIYSMIMILEILFDTVGHKKAFGT